MKYAPPYRIFSKCLKLFTPDLLELLMSCRILNIAKSALALFIVLSFIASHAERIEIRGGKYFCFYDHLPISANWGAQFQSDDGAEVVVTVIDAHEMNQLLNHRLPHLLERSTREARAMDPMLFRPNRMVVTRFV